MKSPQTLFYQEPGHLPLFNLILYGVGSLLFTIVLSFLYGVFIAVSPLVYLNVFVTGIFGLSMAYGFKIISRLFKVFKKKTVITSTLIFAIIGVYLSWVAYLLFVMDNSTSAINFFLKPYLVIHPEIVFEIIYDINAEGLWTIGKMPVNGWLLTLIWIFEVAIIVAIPLIILKSASFSPFSEELNQWYVKYVLNKDFESIVMQSQLLEDFKESVVGTIDALDNGLAYRFSKISVFYLPNETQQYLLVENVSSDRSGKNKRSYPVVEYLKISNQEAEMLIKNYHAKKIFFLEY